MRQVDLGDIQGPILIFGGAYSNLQATQALIDAARANGIPAERCIFTGDSIAYCGSPSETLNLLRYFGCPMIKGNCEIELAPHLSTADRTPHPHHQMIQPHAPPLPH